MKAIIHKYTSNVTADVVSAVAWDLKAMRQSFGYIYIYLQEHGLIAHVLQDQSLVCMHEVQ